MALRRRRPGFGSFDVPPTPPARAQLAGGGLAGDPLPGRPVVPDGDHFHGVQVVDRKAEQPGEQAVSAGHVPAEADRIAGTAGQRHAGRGVEPSGAVPIRRPRLDAVGVLAGVEVDAVPAGPIFGEPDCVLVYAIGSAVDHRMMADHEDVAIRKGRSRFATARLLSESARYRLKIVSLSARARPGLGVHSGWDSVRSGVRTRLARNSHSTSTRDHRLPDPGVCARGRAPAFGRELGRVFSGLRGAPGRVVRSYSRMPRRLPGGALARRFGRGRGCPWFCPYFHYGQRPPRVPEAGDRTGSVRPHARHVRPCTRVPFDRVRASGSFGSRPDRESIRSGSRSEPGTPSGCR